MTHAPSAPIFHLSFPVIDLAGSIAYYTETLGGILGRREEGWADVALFGAQITLQHVPDDVLVPMPRSRHFGATLDWADWENFVSTQSDFAEPPTINYSGTDREQAKAMLCDPSGNLIEVKAYRNPSTVLGVLAAQ